MSIIACISILFLPQVKRSPVFFNARHTDRSLLKFHLMFSEYQATYFSYFYTHSTTFTSSSQIILNLPVVHLPIFPCFPHLEDC